MNTSLVHQCHLQSESAEHYLVTQREIYEDVMGDSLVFFCNGKKITERDLDPHQTLDAYLRTKLRLSGTKRGCGTGGCGSCTVMLSTADPQTGAVCHKSVMACLVPLGMLHGKAVTTVEGIGSTRTRLHAVQERLAKSHGSQCGFCSPGMVMSMYTLIRNKPKPEVRDMLRYLEGNLCRCTGYRAILDGFKSLCGENCCQVTGGSCQADRPEDHQVDGDTIKPYDPTQEPIFPPELLTNFEDYSKTKTFCKGQDKWIVAATLEELLQLLADNPTAQFVAGNTGEKKKSAGPQNILISAGIGIKELTDITTSGSGVTVGSGVTITQLEEYLTQLRERCPEYQSQFATPILDVFQWFAGQQVRNMASVGGSIAGSLGSLDLCIILMATKTTVTLAKAGGKRRTVPLDRDFYPLPNQSIVERDEVIESIHIPFSDQNEFIFSQKVAQRHHGCGTSVTCGFRVTFEPVGDHKVRDLCLVFGGVDVNPTVATKTCNSLIGQSWNQSFLQDAIRSVSSELIPGSHDMGLSAEYRHSLATTGLLRFYVKVCTLINNQEGLVGSFAHGQLSHPSLFSSYNSDCPVTTQIYQPPPQDQPDADPLGRPIIHRAALQQCTGEAAFCDDIPLVEGELHLAMVLSKRAHARIISVDPSRALAMAGVVAFINHTDVQGANMLDPGLELFATEKVHCVGQTIGAVVAMSHELARNAAGLVEVQYEDLQPLILTIQDAIKEQSFLDEMTEFSYGDLEAGFQEAEGILEGEFDLGGQEHFYLEPHTCVVRPGEDGEMEMFASTQALKNLQAATASVLGVPFNRVTCHAKRIGGGFGGKDSNVFCYIACAVSAKKLHQPVRVHLERSTDMSTTGGRQPYHAKYRVGYRSDGRILACDVKIYGNGGCSSGLALWVVRQSMMLLDSIYHFPGYRVRGFPCRTNLSSNIPMRGAGAPQGLAIIEHIMTEVAMATNLPTKQVQEINFKPEGLVMLEGARPRDMMIFRECWDTCLRLSEYEKRLQEVNEFNSKNCWKKRGISIVPSMHGMGMFPTHALDQGAALVHIYTDGSVMINHGGIEMGQGLNTKMVQVASKVLEIPFQIIHTSTTGTDKVPNTTLTAGSIGTDLFGGAVKAACETLKERLQPYKAANPKGTWNEWVGAAYLDRVSLSTTGFYKKPGNTMDWATLKGNPYQYYTMGVGVSEVEIDCLTGEHQLLRTDIVMDVGKSLNPAIDIGQVEGGFIQGYGFFTMEEKRFSTEGTLLTDGPITYKIPTVRDIPKEFNVTLLRNMRTPEDHLYSSKGIGEPPFFIGASAFFAIKHALISSRKDNGLDGRFKFNAPATVENVRMQCGDVCVRASASVAADNS